MYRKKRKRLFEESMARALAAEQKGEFGLAFAELEHAHILGQRWLVRHLRSHWAMLRIGRLTGNHKEVRGQIIRLIGSPLFWLVGWLPKGNTGGANVSPLKPMQLHGELAAELAGYRVWLDVASRVAIGCVMWLGFKLAFG